MTNDQLTSDESANERTKASKRTSNARSMKSESFGSELSPTSAAERPRPKCEEKAQPFIDRLAAAPSERFCKELELLFKELKRNNAKPDEVQFFLRAVLRHVPVCYSGAMVVKYFKSKSDWSDPDRVVAIVGLKDAIVARKEEILDLGPLLHGALIALIGAAKAPAPRDASAARQDEIVTALLALHAVIWVPDRIPLTDLEGTPTRNMLDQAVALFASHGDRADVKAVVGQRLFGFDREFAFTPAAPTARRPEPIKVAGDADVHAAPAAPTGPGSAQHLRAVTLTKVPGGAVSPAIEDSRSAAAAAAKLDIAASVQARKELKELRGVVAALHGDLAALHATLAHSNEFCELQTTRVAELESALEVAAQVGVQFQEEQARNQAANLRIVQLKGALQEAEENARSAKDREFDRGRSAMRATIAAHCREPLRHVAETAATLEGDAGKFICAAAISLTRYLEEGNS